MEKHKVNSANEQMLIIAKSGIREVKNRNESIEKAMMKISAVRTKVNAKPKERDDLDRLRQQAM